jgi:molecular chaperone DnaK (HSP70)
MQEHWAIDLGTTNTVVAVEELGSVRAMHLPDLGRKLPVEQFPLIPSAVQVTERPGTWRTFFRRRREVFIGQTALSRNFDGRSPAFAQSFKPYLAMEPHRPMLRLPNGQQFTARDVAALFLRELLQAIRKQQRSRVLDLTIPTPVAYFEHYRAELQSATRQLGVKRFRSLDEPVAAALGYGVNVGRDETLLVVDFGGGTLNLAVMRLGPQAALRGRTDVLAKHMIRIGGNDVDTWILDHLFPRQAGSIWPYNLRWEAVRVKEELSQTQSVEFSEDGLRSGLTRDDLLEILAKRGLFDQLRIALRDIQRQLLDRSGEAVADVEEVLMVGGSTLLPGVPAAVDDFFPQAVVRHDPGYVFSSVALGAARFAGGLPVEDFIYHDYGLAVQNVQSQGHLIDYELLVPRRSRYPTAPNAIVRYYGDYQGMEEVRFSVAEIGRLGQEPVAWELRNNGNRYWAPKTIEERALVSELNPQDTTLPLSPRGEGKSPRLRVMFSVNEDRWLCVTAEDLIAKRFLQVDEPLVRLR